MIETYKNIKTKVKKGLYTIGGTFLITALLSTGVLAQEGNIDDKLNEEVSKPNNISYTIKEEQKSLEDISNEINQNVKEQRENVFKIGRWEGYTKTINGVDYHFVDGLDYAFLKCEIKSDNIPTFIASSGHAKEHGLEGALSAIKYNKDDVKFYRESIEQKKDEKDIYIVYVKTNIKKEDIKN